MHATIEMPHQNGAEAQGRSRARLVVLGVGLVLACATVWAAEPTEREMRAAVEAKFGAVNAKADETAQRCNNREFNQGQGDVFLALECLAYGAAGGIQNGGREVRAPRFQLSHFEKIACEKAQGQAGYICDYVYAFGSNMPNQAVDGITRTPTATQGRFLQSKGAWVLLAATQ